METLLRHPVVLYLLVAITSIAAALILFEAGGSLAEVTSEGNEVIGFGFRAGGALAGFIIILMLSVRVLQKFNDFGRGEDVGSKMSMKFHLEGAPEAFARNSPYVGKIDLFDEDSGEKKTIEVTDFRWENRALTFDLPEIKKSHLLAIKVTDENGRSWLCDHFYARVRTQTLEQKSS